SELHCFWQSRCSTSGALPIIWQYQMHDLLLIEDSDSDAEMVKRALRQARVRNPVIRLIDGFRAMEHITRIEQAFETGTPPAPSVLLLDLKLPGTSGFEILAEIKN